MFNQTVYPNHSKETIKPARQSGGGEERRNQSTNANRHKIDEWMSLKKVLKIKDQ